MLCSAIFPGPFSPKIRFYVGEKLLQVVSSNLNLVGRDKLIDKTSFDHVKVCPATFFLTKTFIVFLLELLEKKLKIVFVTLLLRPLGGI